MGTQASRNAARKPPARYVAQQLPRPLKAVEEEFAKAKHTITGINKLTERVSTTPQPYVETKATDESTEVTEHAAPRWYVNTWLELMDNTREDRHIYTGNLPSSWFRDHYEPYGLVRNRIDDEDLDWVLTEGKKLPMEQLVESTKLERETLEDILATVEAPRRQFRNYKGKLRKAIDDPNEFLQDRKKRIEENRDEEILRSIGYSDEDIMDEKQYYTQRSRGVKTLDELGASIRQRKRSDRAAQHNDMQALLDERRVMEIESGLHEATEEDLTRPVELASHRENPKGHFYKAKEQHNKQLFRMDHNHPTEMRKMQNIKWWQQRRASIKRGPDHIPDAPVYNERLSQTESEMNTYMEEEIQRTQTMARAQGAKSTHDPREKYDEFLDAVRQDQRQKQFMSEAEARGEKPEAAAKQWQVMEESKAREELDAAQAKARGNADLSKQYQPRRREQTDATPGAWFNTASYSNVTTPVSPLNEKKEPVNPVGVSPPAAAGEEKKKDDDDEKK